MARWLVIAGAVIAALLVVLVMLVRGEHATPQSRDAGPVTHGSDPIAHVAPLASPADARAGDASADIAAREQRETLLAGLRDSGSGAEAWDGQGTTLLASVASGGIAIRDATCFVAGCSAIYTFPSERDYERRVRELEASDTYRAWTGGKRFSPPERRPDGTVVVALLLYRPD